MKFSFMFNKSYAFVQHCFEYDRQKKDLKAAVCTPGQWLAVKLLVTDPAGASDFCAQN